VTAAATAAVAFAACALGLSAGGCVDKREGLTDTQSLRVELRAIGGVSPADPGSPENPIDTANRDVEIVVSAIGPDGEIDTEFEFQVFVRAQFLGRVTPALNAPPIQLIQLTAGVSQPTTVTLPPEVFGPTVIWIEDAGDGGSFATGTSPILYYRDPFVSDLQRPADEESIDALSSSPLVDRQIRVVESEYGANGKLVVTSIYAQGYTVSDVECGPGGAPPCVGRDYGHVLVFTFNRPRDENGCDVFVGEIIDGFAGAVQEFNGLTEIGFPQTFVAATAGFNCDARVVDPASLPPPAHVAVDGPDAWVENPALPQNGAIQFERNEAGLVSVDTATLGDGLPVACPLDEQFETFKQWELDVGIGCDDPISVITAGTVSSWIPQDHVGETLTQVVGSLRPVNASGGFNVWILFPRSADDLVP
jgi:hypothetical protein